MLWSRKELEDRAAAYAEANGVQLGEELGYGANGIVFGTNRKTALKVHGREPEYRRERDAYFRLRDNEITELRGLMVPRLVGWDDDSWILEMAIVTPPFLLDFAGAYLDFPPEFSRETMADWHEEKREQFGPRWHEVQLVLRALEEYGIYYQDPNPGNIRFGSEEDELRDIEMERNQ